MVDRTNVLGEVIGVTEQNDNNPVVDVKPFGSPLLLIFLCDNKDVINKLVKLDKVFYCKSVSINIFTSHGHHILTYVPLNEVKLFVERLGNVSQIPVVVAIDSNGETGSKSPLNKFVWTPELSELKFSGKKLFRLDFSGYSDDYVIEYLTEFLKVE